MSWEEKLQNPFIITTGDGKQYTVLWRSATNSEEFNVTRFAFPKLRGERVDRREVLGREFPLEFYFQGEDHLDTAEGFRISSHDKRFWIIDHPLYGRINGHPVRIQYDNSDFNYTRITTTIIETITDDAPKSEINPMDQVKLLKEINDEDLALALTSDPDVTDVNTMAKTNDSAYKKGVPIIELPEEAENYYNLFNTASTYINTATASPLLAMRATIAMLSYPSQFTTSAQTRVDLLTDQFGVLRATVSNMVNVSSKQIYQGQGAALLSSMCQAAATPLETDYRNSVNVLEIIRTVLDNYNSFLEDLDELQGENGGNPLNFIPSADPMIALSTLINNTLSSLYALALNARTERTIIMEQDTNVILLTHRLYGLDDEDKNIEELMENNAWGWNQILQVEKNTSVKYYI